MSGFCVWVQASGFLHLQNDGNISLMKDTDVLQNK